MRFPVSWLINICRKKSEMTYQQQMNMTTSNEPEKYININI